MLKSKSFWFVVKIIVSISLLSFIIININWKEAIGNFQKANYYFLLITLLLFVIERIVTVYKWNLLIKARGIKIAFTRLFTINLVGSFWGLFIPSSLGTDVARGYYLAKNNAEKSISISSVFVDRILGTFSIFLLAIVSVILSGDLLSQINIKPYVIIFSVVMVIGFYIFQREQTAQILASILTKTRNKKLAEIFIKLHRSILEYKKYPRAIWLSFFFTIVAHVSRVLIFYFVALSFSIYIPLIYFFLFIPIITLIIMIPISVGGLGVGESAFVAFFSLIGIPLSSCIVMAFTSSLINTLFTLSGGVIYLFYKNQARVDTVGIDTQNTELKKM